MATEDIPGATDLTAEAAADAAVLDKQLGNTPPEDDLPADRGGDSDVDDHDDDDEGTARVDEELAAAQNDAERERIQAQRRQDRRERKQRAREKREQLERTVESLQRANQNMQQQLQTLTKHQTGAQLSQIDAAIKEADDLAARFKDIVADATTKGDGRTAAEATERMILARERAKQLTAYKERATTAISRQNQNVAPAVVQHGAKFIEQHKSWFKGPQSTDADSRIVGMLDDQLAAEGWNPETAEYWAELERRGAKYLPHRFKDGGGLSKPPTPGYNSPGQTPQRGSPVAGSTRTSVSTGRQEGMRLSAERVQAMKEAGMWDDPKLRESMIARYKAEDASRA